MSDGGRTSQIEEPVGGQTTGPMGSGTVVVVERAVVVDGKVEVRPVMYLALSYDHRLIDGREAVSFLVRIKQALEDPARMLMEV